jgi:hypothetical protein
MTSSDKPDSPFTVIDGDGASAQQEGLTPAADNDEGLLMKITQLEQEHRDLDHAIDTLEERMPYERLTLQRMKKRKLALKDQIVSLKDRLTPDIIA